VSDRPVVVKITASDAYGGSVDEYLDVLVQPRTENELPTRETAPDLGPPMKTRPRSSPWPSCWRALAMAIWTRSPSSLAA
jgi:hypothetical protein